MKIIIEIAKTLISRAENPSMSGFFFFSRTY
jgi:hypothetical protein